MKPILKNEIKAEIKGISRVEDNILDAKEYALSLKEYYSNLVFNDDQIKEAKEERASINKIVKSIADYRKNIVAEFKKPIEQFETTAKETEKILKETSEYVDVQVKKFENEEKEKKKKEIEKLYENNIEELKGLVDFNKLFNGKWLNKTTSLETIEKELKEKLEEVRNGLKAIEKLNSKYETEIKNTFLQDFDLPKAIIKNNQLKEQEEKLSKVEETKEEIKQEKIETMLKEEIKEDVSDPVMTYTLRITAPLSKQQALRNFLELNNMKFEKVTSNVL